MNIAAVIIPLINLSLEDIARSRSGKQPVKRENGQETASMASIFSKAHVESRFGALCRIGISMFLSERDRSEQEWTGTRDSIREPVFRVPRSRWPTLFVNGSNPGSGLAQTLFAPPGLARRFRSVLPDAPYSFETFRGQLLLPNTIVTDSVAPSEVSEEAMVICWPSPCNCVL